MRLGLKSLWDFTHFVYCENNIKKFVEFTLITHDLLKKFGLSTHSALDKHIAQLCRLLYLSKKYRYSLKSLYELYNLKRLEDIVKTLNMFRNDILRIRVYVYKSLMFYINEILNDIINTTLVYETKIKYANVVLNYIVREDTVSVDATYTLNSMKITSHFVIEAHGLRERLYKMKNCKIDTREQILLTFVFRRIRDIVNKYQTLEIPAFLK